MKYETFKALINAVETEVDRKEKQDLSFDEIRASAKKMGIPIITASQLNRSTTNNIDEVDNSNVSDSVGAVMTADFMLSILQNEEVKEQKEIVCKITFG